MDIRSGWQDIVMLLIVKVMTENADVIVEFFLYLVDKGAFAAACSSGYSDNDRIFHNIIPSLLLNPD